MKQVVDLQAPLLTLNIFTKSKKTKFVYSRPITHRQEELGTNFKNKHFHHHCWWQKKSCNSNFSICLKLNSLDKFRCIFCKNIDISSIRILKISRNKFTHLSHSGCSRGLHSFLFVEIISIILCLPYRWKSW